MDLLRIVVRVANSSGSKVPEPEEGTMKTVKINGTTIEILENMIRTTPMGVQGAAKIRMPDGRTIELEGTWDNPWKGTDERPAVLEEKVTIDGVVQEPEDENGVWIIHEPNTSSDEGMHAEDIALKIAT